MGLLILQTDKFQLVVEGMDTPDTEPLVLRTRCLACGTIRDTRVLAADETTMRTSHQLAEADAEVALAHRVLCRGHG